jgi:hypothetical protein
VGQFWNWWKKLQHQFNCGNMWKLMEKKLQHHFNCRNMRKLMKKVATSQQKCGTILELMKQVATSRHNCGKIFELMETSWKHHGITGGKIGTWTKMQHRGRTVGTSLNWWNKCNITAELWESFDLPVI